MVPGVQVVTKQWNASRVDRSGIVTALPRFARPGRDWIHHESLASAVRPVSHRSGTVTAQVS